MDRDTAEDIVQQAFVKCLKYINSYDPEKGSPKVWFNKVLYGELKDYRASYVADVHLDDELLYKVDDPKVILLIDEEINAISNYNHRRIVELFYRNGYSVNEIAKYMNTNPSNVTTVCNRFKRNLAIKCGVK
jgi:RNA polymerase sigma factor (sigma-70 family)